jgi:hypothetical protein
VEALALRNSIVCRNAEIRKHPKEQNFEKDSKESFGIFRNIQFFWAWNFQN